MTPLGAVVRGMLAGAAGTAAMDAVWYARYRKGGGTSGFPEWETAAGLDSFEAAPAPAQVGKRVAEGLLQRELKPRSARLVTNLVHARFFDFLLARYQGDIHALTGCVLVQPIDEFNRPATAGNYGITRIPPQEHEVERLFAGWRAWLPTARKYLPAARDYFAASLWRRVGLRINETVMLDLRDWRPDLGAHGKLHVRFGKGSRGRGPKTRLVSAINQVDALMGSWLADVRHQFGDDWADPDAPLLPSERRDRDFGGCLRVGGNAVRDGLATAVATWLPDWSGRLSPHGLRHFCASSLYARGVDLKAIQELLGHEWLSTTTRYIHVHDDHVERAWAAAHARTSARLDARLDQQPREGWGHVLESADEGR
jgi:site-specific recombinase XerD